jgi:hypothetical protein
MKNFFRTKTNEDGSINIQNSSTSKSVIKKGQLENPSDQSPPSLLTSDEKCEKFAKYILYIF